MIGSLEVLTSYMKKEMLSCIFQITNTSQITFLTRFVIVTIHNMQKEYTFSQVEDSYIPLVILIVMYNHFRHARIKTDLKRSSSSQ